MSTIYTEYRIHNFKIITTACSPPPTPPRSTPQQGAKKETRIKTHSHYSKNYKKLTQEKMFFFFVFLKGFRNNLKHRLIDALLFFMANPSTDLPVWILFSLHLYEFGPNCAH